MDRLILAAIFLGCSVAAHAQWCFSQFNNCNQTPAVVFAPKWNSTQVPYRFRPIPLLQGYRPVQPLERSPITRQFFSYAEPGSELHSHAMVPLPHASMPTAGSGTSGNLDVHIPLGSPGNSRATGGGVFVPYSIGR